MHTSRFCGLISLWQTPMVVWRYASALHIYHRDNLIRLNLLHNNWINKGCLNNHKFNTCKVAITTNRSIFHLMFVSKSFLLHTAACQLKLKTTICAGLTSLFKQLLFLDMQEMAILQKISYYGGKLRCALGPHAQKLQLFYFCYSRKLLENIEMKSSNYFYFC